MIIDSLKYNGLCDCGKNHTMQTLFSVIESGCMKKLNEYLSEYKLGGFTVAVYDENTYKATADRHPSVDLEVILNPENLHANEVGVDLLCQKLTQTPNTIIAIGSGTIHDLSRYCAYIKNADFVSCPTAASVDGFCSSVAAMTWKGCKKTLTAVAPKIVVADLDIIVNAPLYLAKSGFGDMIGKYVALTDWKISNIITGEFFCEKIYNMTIDATNAVVSAVDGILNFQALAYEKLMYGLLMSGLAMQLMGNSRPASGAEHHISHIIEMSPKKLKVSSDALHGEKVGVGTLLAIGEYQRLRRAQNICFEDYVTYSDEYILDMYGEQMCKEILQENKNDCAAGIKSESIRDNWDKICVEIDRLPDIGYLASLYNKYSIKSTLSDIGILADIEKQLLDYSPTVRNRVTLMRLRKCIK